MSPICLLRYARCPPIGAIFSQPTPGELPLRRLAILVKKVEAATGLARGGYTLSLVPEVEVEGEVAGKVVKESFAPRLPLQLDRFQLQLPAPTGEPAQGAPALQPR